MMKTYNYLENMVNDIKYWIDDNHWSLEGGKEYQFEQLHDRLLTEESVTGNDSGSYTFNPLVAERNLYGNVDLLKEAVEELDPILELIERDDEGYDEGYDERCDVLIRCYLLDKAITQVLEDLEV